jgi:hypothetical protein
MGVAPANHSLTERDAAMTDWTWTGHGPEPCEGCGVTHSHVRLHIDENGELIIDDATAPQLRDVVFWGFTDDGRALWTDAPDETP